MEFATSVCADPLTVRDLERLSLRCVLFLISTHPNLYDFQAGGEITVMF